MTEKKLIEEAFEEFNQDKNETYIISNLLFELKKKESFEEVIKNLTPFPDEFFSDTGVIISFYRKSITAGYRPKDNELDNFQLWVESGLTEKIDFGKSTVCLNVATFFSPGGNDFGDESLNKKYASLDRVRKWVNLAVEHAENIDQYSNIIEQVALPHQGLNLEDKKWAIELADFISTKLDDKDLKKFKKAIKHYF